MGQLLALLAGRHADPSPVPLVALNLHDPAVSESEARLVAEIKALLGAAPSILAQLKAYAGCEEAIRVAISQPSPQSEADAWAQIVPAVTTLKGFYDHAVRIEQLMPAILDVFCKPSDGGQVDVQKNLEANQATAKAFADLISFAWEFDENKMSKPAVQNDFSYYRRTISRTRTSAPAGGTTLPVADELANRMSLFYAYPAPIQKLITDTVSTYVSQHKLADAVSAYLMLIAGVCQNAINTQSSISALFALRVMTSCLVLYDHIHPVGLFLKQADVNVLRMFVKTIQTHGGSSATTLLNSLRFSSKTFNNLDVPKQTKALLENPTP